MINIIPVFGWFVSFLISFLLSIPTYYLWNYLAPIYLGPIIDVKYHAVYLTLPFFDIVFLIMLISIIKGVLLTSRCAKHE